MNIQDDIIDQFIQRFREDGYAMFVIPIPIPDVSDDDIKIELIREFLSISMQAERPSFLCAFAKDESLIVDGTGGYEIVIRPILRDMEAQDVD